MFYSNSGFAQNQDSIYLKSVLTKAASLRFNNPDSSLILLHSNAKLFANTPHKNLKGEFEYWKSLSHYIKGDYDSSLYYNSKAEKWFSEAENMLGKVRVLNNFGLIYSVWKEYRLALTHFNRATEIFKTMDNKDQLFYVTFNTSIVYNDLAKYDSALINFSEALQIAEQYNFKLSVFRAKTMLAETHVFLNEGVKALNYLNKINLEDKEIGDWDRGFTYGVLAKAQSQLNNHNDAIQSALSGIEIQKRLNAKWELFRLYQIIAQEYEKT